MAFNRRVGLILNVVAGVLVAFVVLTLGTGIYLYQLSKTLPNLRVDPQSISEPRTSIVYAADGSKIAEWHGEQDRTVVPFDEMPGYLRNAVVAIEDQRFYTHNGVDVEGIMRALTANAKAGEVREGGSTITQQLVKLLFTDGQRTLTRKIREALMAYQLEAKADKDQVLETYLNTVYFGTGAYGVEAASQRYFGAPTSSLDLPQSALLAGIIQSPSRFNPVDDRAGAIERRNLVLTRMREQGYITSDEEGKAKRAKLKIKPPREVPATAPYFVEYVKQDLIERLGADKVYNGGLRVFTTLDPKVQGIAEKSTRVLSNSSDPEVAVAAVRHGDGAVLAMVGGRDFTRNQFNLAAQGHRQPGSSFKPFVLVAALEEGINPQQVFDASPYEVAVTDASNGKRSVWKVQNYENNRTSGRITLRAATNWSVNAVYARLIMLVGPGKVVDVARRLGIESPLDPNPAIALGGLRQGVTPLEMASAYGTLANGGVAVKPTGIVKVTDDRGRMVYKPKRSEQQVLDRAVAVRTSLMLHDVIESGTGTAARIPVWSAGKTGTTQSYRDAWFVGWAGDISTAVWVGYPQAQVAMTDVHGIRVTGGSFPAKIWANFMRQATATRSKAVTPPSASQGNKQVQVRVCQQSMKLANSRCPSTVDIYLDDALVPKETCDAH